MKIEYIMSICISIQKTKSAITMQQHASNRKSIVDQRNYTKLTTSSNSYHQLFKRLTSKLSWRKQHRFPDSKRKLWEFLECTVICAWRQRFFNMKKKKRIGSPKVLQQEKSAQKGNFRTI